MKIDLLIPDIAEPRSISQTGETAQASALFSQAYDHAAGLLDHAQECEKQFAAGSGSLLEMTTARATADVALSTAVAIATRISQFGTTLGNMSL